KREECAFLAIPYVSANAEVRPIKCQPPVTLSFAAIDILRSSRRSKMLNIKVRINILGFRKPTFAIRQRKQPGFEFFPNRLIVFDDLIALLLVGSVFPLLRNTVRLVKPYLGRRLP